MNVVERPDSAPAEGLVPAFDAGWNAHEVGLGRATVAAFSPSPEWALLGWDIRRAVCGKLEEQA